MSTSNDEYTQIAKDGVISGALGSAAAVARAILSPTPVKLIWVIRSSIAAAIVAMLVGLAVIDYIASMSLRFAVAGLAGLAAPQVMDFALKALQKAADYAMDWVNDWLAKFFRAKKKDAKRKRKRK